MKNLRYKGILEGDGQWEAKKFPVSLLHGLELFMRDFHARRRIRSARNSRHFDRRIRMVVVILEDRLVAGVPVGHLATHIPNLMCINDSNDSNNK